jgi:hypothetical protein
MLYKECESGLLVPEQPRAPPKRRYGPTEIQDEDRRRLAEEGLLKLWDAMQLSDGGCGIRLPGYTGVRLRDVYTQVYHYVGKMLLGEDCPEKEVLT